MSPEQARGEKRLILGRTSGAGGVVFYEMLTGRRPFTGATNSDVIAEIPQERTLTLGNSLPQSLVHILMKSLSKELAARYASMPECLLDVAGLRRHIKDDGELRHEPLSNFKSLGSQASKSSPF
jgi:serine/threonine protein kinase